MRLSLPVCALLASATLSSGSFNPAPAEISFTDIASTSGVDYSGDWIFFGSGAAMVDFDGDGDLDIYAGNGAGETNFLFRNDGGLTFVDVAADAGVDFADSARSVVFGDYDNDGDPDLFVSRWNELNGLYRNDGGVFADVTGTASVGFSGASTGAAWGDLDADGYLDLYVVNYYWGRNRCYRNNGDGTFDEIATDVGIDYNNYGFQPALFDMDNDGDLDIYVAIDKMEGNVLYRNDGDWQFVDVSHSSGTDVQICGMGLTTGDYNNDGFLDMYTTSGPGGHPLLRNRGDGTFDEVSEEMNAAVYRNGWGTEFFDADLDGDLDLYVNHFFHPALPEGHHINVMLENPGQGPFVDVSTAAGVDDERSSYGLAIGDVDGDGRPDMFVTNQYAPAALYLNTSDIGGNHWLAIETEGKWSNRDGIGARVTISAGGKVQVRQVRAGTAYLSQGERAVRFGLGTATVADWVRIDWPSGHTDLLTGVAGDQIHHITEGTATVDVADGGAPVSRELLALPNPSRGPVTFHFPDGAAGATTVLILDSRGRLVRRLEGTDHTTASGILRWDGRGGHGRPVPAGVYLYRLLSADASASGKIVMR